jgi:DNA-binding protein HU-beta
VVARLLSAVVLHTNPSKVQATNTLNSALDGIVSTLKQRGKVKLVGFGTFSASSRKARPGRNPQTVHH